MRANALIRETGSCARQGRQLVLPRITNRCHDHPIVLNSLQRNVVAGAPDQMSLANIAYIATDDGWLYRAAITDTTTREILGWSMADHLETGLYFDALVIAVRPHSASAGLIHLSDLGVQVESNPLSQHSGEGVEMPGRR
jgi:putative transposase